LQMQLADGLELATQLIGAYNFTNVAAALCIGKYFQVPMDSALQAVRAYNPQNNRSQVLQKGDNTLILDAYNANPSSMKAALDNLRTMRSPHKSVILGDMKELGDQEVLAHQQLGQDTEQGIDRVIFCGDLMLEANKHNPKSEYYVNKEELIAALKIKPISNSTILIKGSRSMGLEEIIDYL